MTVKELIELLQTMPADAPVILADADTGWDLLPHASLGDTGTVERGRDDNNPNAVYLWGDYAESREFKDWVK